MSEQTHADRNESPSHFGIGLASPASSFVPLSDGRVARFDPAEPFTEGSMRPPAEQTNPPMTASVPFAAPTERPDEDLLSQASQLVDHLRNQFAEAHRRDQAIANQAHQLEQERQQLQLWRQEAEHQLHAKETQLREREVTLAEQAAAQQAIVDQTQKQQEEVARRREQLDADRVRLLAEVGTKVAAEREQLQLAIAAAEADRQRLQSEFDQHRAQLEDAVRTKLAEVETAKARVREDVTEEVLTAELRADREEFLRQTAEFEQAQTAWTAQRISEQSALQNEREIQDAAVARIREELLAQRQQHSAELEAARARQETELEAAQEEFSRTRDQQANELRHERAVLENRLRFQQEHLTKARQEIEAAQNDFRRDAQRVRSQLEEGESIVRMRQSQLDRVRSLLEERERSVNREREMLFKSQQAFAISTEYDRERIQHERETWDRERNAQSADLRRQQDMLAMHAQNLEGRRERLDRLRSELEETHRTTLEMRMGIEEAWAQITQVCGEDIAKQRIEAAQQQLSGHYRLLRETLAEQRRELEEMQQAFQQQRDEFRTEQQTLSEWATTQDRKFREREESLLLQDEQIGVRENAWRSAAQRWINEKIEAEAVIRDLLQQLTSLTEPTSTVSMWPAPTMPVFE